MKRISIAKTFIIILIILIALFISGSYLMGNMTEKNLQYTIRQFSDKGIGIKKYEKGIFTSSLTLSVGAADIAKINIIHMPIILSANNLFNKHVFLLEALGHVTLFNKNNKISSQEVLVNLNGDIDTKFKVFLPKETISALKSINANLPDDAITGSLLINASHPNVIKAKLKSLIDLKNISSNMLLPIKLNINNASLNLDFYFEKSKVSDEIDNKTNIIFNIVDLSIPSMKLNVQDIKIALKVNPKSISPMIIMQTVFGDPLQLLNLISSDLSLEINNFVSNSSDNSNSKSYAKNIKLNLSLNGKQDNLESRIQVILNEIHTMFFNTQNTAFETSVNINKDVLFHDIPNIINQAKQNELNISDEKINELFLKIQQLLISFDTNKLNSQHDNFGTLNLDKFKFSFDLSNKHNNAFITNEITLKNLEWDKSSSGKGDFTGKLQKTNASIHSNFNLSNFILGRNSEIIYNATGNLPDLKVKFPTGEFNLNKLILTGKGTPNNDNSELSINSIKFNEYDFSNIKFDSILNNLNSFTYVTLINHPLIQETKVYNSKLTTDMLIYLVKKGFNIKQNFSMSFPNENNQRLLAEFDFVSKPNEKDNISKLSQDKLSEFIFDNSNIKLDISLPVFLYDKLQKVVNTQAPNFPSAIQKSLPSILNVIKDKNIIVAKDNSYELKFSYKQGNFYLNSHDLLKLIEKVKSDSNQKNEQSNNEAIEEKTD